MTFERPDALLTDFERRLLGNLPQPRNVAEVAEALRHDENSVTLGEGDVHTQLEYLKERGWAVNLGSFDSPVKAAVAAEKDPDARTLHDDLVSAWARRLAAPRQQWRAEGDLWLFTNAGFDKLHEPTVDSRPLPPSRVQAAIDAEWERTVRGPVDRTIDGNVKVSLANALLEDEFAAWAKSVADECERVWNVRPTLPISGGQQYSDFYENLLLDAENQKTALGAVVDPWYMALTTVAVTDSMTGSTITEANYTGYARKSVAGTDMPAASGAGGSVANTSAITFAACTAGTSTVIGFAHCVASTVGNVRKFGTCTSTVVSVTQTPASFAIGAYTTTVA